MIDCVCMCTGMKRRMESMRHLWFVCLALVSLLVGCFLFCDMFLVFIFPCSKPSLWKSGLWGLETPYDPEPPIQGEVEAPTYWEPRLWCEFNHVQSVVPKADFNLLAYRENGLHEKLKTQLTLKMIHPLPVSARSQLWVLSSGLWVKGLWLTMSLYVENWSLLTIMQEMGEYCLL